jgi:hypothetical protein
MEGGEEKVLGEARRRRGILARRGCGLDLGRDQFVLALLGA